MVCEASRKGKRDTFREESMKIRRGMRNLLIAATAFAACGTVAAAAAEPVRFVVIGDLPYSADQYRTLETELRPGIAKGGFPFVVHVGDFKGGGVPCSDEGLERAYRQIMSLIPERVFYTPGDNDWTDCDRGKLNAPIWELKRLDRLREVFYSKSPAVPEGWHYRRQEDYPENAMWRFGGIQFATLHVVGTNNGRVEIELDDKSTALDAVDARDAANARWLDSAFASAVTSAASALVVAMQADITKVGWDRKCSRKHRAKCDGFASVRDQLIVASAAFRKPVLLVHGDTGRYCIDRDFGGDAAPNLWRLNSAGDWIVDATVIEFDPSAPDAGFSFIRIRENVPLESLC